jgi:pimeloyl-ACP methyl ester carboxylesterase
MGPLTRFARVTIFDKRGMGMSDPVDNVPLLEERMDDVRAVMDAAGIERAALIGFSEGAQLAILFCGHVPAARPGHGPLWRTGSLDLGARLSLGQHQGSAD